MKLKAYGWDDEDYDESQVVWAATPGKAKALNHGWWLYCSNCGTRVQNDTATVLSEVEVLCDECAKDWNEVKK